MKAEYDAAVLQQRRDILRQLIQRVDLAAAALHIHVDLLNLARKLIGRELSVDPVNERDRTKSIECRFSLRRRGIETKVILADPSVQRCEPDKGLVRLLISAHDYLRQLTDGSGRGIGQVAAANGVDRSDFTRTLRLAFLAPDLVDRILIGTLPVELTAQALSRLAELPHSWVDQSALLGR